MSEPNPVREHLGRAIHERYCQNQRGIKPPDDPALRPWEELAEDLRESNRQQADDIVRKLGLIGCALRPAAQPAPAPSAFTSEEVELLSAEEHQLWVAERQAAGWTLGSRDVARKTTPYLVPYADLPDDIKEYDRQAVRAIPEVVAQAGMEVVRVR